MKIGGLIVAAGLSSRMGAFKPMLPLKGETILRRGVLTMLEAGCDPVAVVTGHRAEELHESLSDLPVTCLYNPEYARSQMLDSVKLGLQWLVDQCDQVLFSPGDVCLYREETVRVLVNRKSLFAQPVYQGQPGHPVLFLRRFSAPNAPKPHPAAYAAAANVVSFATGYFISRLLPQIFS